MRGEVVQFLPDGKMNNVDLREGFALSGEHVVLVTASNRTDDSIAIYRLNTATRRLAALADGVHPTGFDDTYGLCLYPSPHHAPMSVSITIRRASCEEGRLMNV